jgi:hypothetical protein
MYCNLWYRSVYELERPIQHINSVSYETNYIRTSIGFSAFYMCKVSVTSVDGFYRIELGGKR